MGESNIYKIGVKNVMYSLLAQGISFVLSIVTGFMLPKVMGVTQYGYWQVYLFYIGYIMLFCFGFNDGLYLRYGNVDYNNLPFDRLRSAMRIFIVAILIVSGILFLFSLLEHDANKIFAFCAVSINLLILGINGTLLTILQFTNRMKLNSTLIIVNKIIFVAFILILLLIKWIDFRLIIAADIFTKLLLLGVIVYKSKELFIGSKTQSIGVGFIEYKENIKIGIHLMLANIVSSLLIGIGRFIVERFMSIESYGLYSFATTITFFSLIFITASSLSLYPLLKRLPKENLTNFYVNLNKLLCLVLFTFLAGYYPLFYLIKYQFFNYSGIFEYFYLMFIIIIAEGKMQFLINTYYKVLRKEKAMLLANLGGVIVALILIIPTFYITHSIFAIVVGTTITIILRCYASEIYIKKKMNLKGYENIAIELSMMSLFIICIASGASGISFILYLLGVGVYAFMSRTVLKRYTIKLFKMAIEK